MTPERYNRVAELFLAVRGRDAPSRSSYLAEQCRDDPSLAVEVESLLSGEKDSTDLLGSGSGDAGARVRALLLEGAGAGVPERLGQYRIAGVLGQGGMGVVYRAEQERPKRAVALKVVRPGLLSPSTLRRFEIESSALARLHHAGIAQVYEAGVLTGADGSAQPYFAMELVEGTALTDYAKGRGLGLKQRLELLVKVCAAVQHAHQKGIIHRDLKPGNILVDESGQPKILDFGVARLTDADAVEGTLNTLSGAVLGTLAYMSPEQASGDAYEVDTRSDVYSLGVIAYELLAGRLPIVLAGKSLPEAVRAIGEEEPARLGSVRRELRGDVETIVARAMEKDRARRYASSAGLGADIERFLNHEPVAARPATAWYQARKFARRHRALVAGVGAVLVTLVGGVVSTGMALSRARAEAVRAQKQATIAEAVSTAMSDIFGRANRGMQGGNPDVTVREAMDLAVQDLDSGKYEYVPEVEASVRAAIGDTYKGLGLLNDAERMFRTALQLRAGAAGADDIAVAGLKNNLASLLTAKGEYDEAASLLVEAAARAHAEGPSAAGLEADSLNNLGTIQKRRGDFAGAVASYNAAFPLYRAAFGEESLKLASALNNLAHMYHEKNELDAAEPLYRRSIEMRRHLSNDLDPLLATGMDNLGSLLAAKGDFEHAEPMILEALAMATKLYGDEHAEVAYCLNNTGTLYFQKGDLTRAAEYLGACVDIRRKVLPEGHSETAATIRNLATSLYLSGDLAAAEPLYMEALEAQRKALGEANPNVALTLNNLALLLSDKGDSVAAERCLRDALAGLQKSLGMEHPGLVETWNNLGLVLASQERYSEAEPVLRQSAETARKALGAKHPYLGIALLNLGQVMLEMGNLEEAEPALRESTVILTGFFGPSHPRRWMLTAAKICLGRTLADKAAMPTAAPDARRELAAEAEPLLVEGVAALDAGVAKFSERKQRELETKAAAGLGKLYRARDREQPGQGFDAKASVWEKKAAGEGPGAG